MRAVEPAAVALGTSAGHETPTSKAAMRGTVLVSDVVLFFPAAAVAVAAFGGGGRTTAAAASLWPLAAALLNPAAILIDHAHFQYNCISLALAAASFAAATVAAPRSRGGVAAGMLSTALYCAAVHHKHMALYYGPGLAAYLLGRCLQQPTLGRKAGAIVAHAAAAAATFALVWWPWLTDPAGPVAGVAPALARLAPLGRGLFEDYVSNFWCASHPLFKWKRRFAQATLARAATAATLAAATPAAARQVLAPSVPGLAYCLASSAFAFYMFGYQVHEKSILLPLLPITLAAAREQTLAAILPAVAAFSMWPLLARDGVWSAYAGCLLVWGGLAAPFVGGGWRRQASVVAAVAAAATLHAAAAFIPPPASLPWLWDAVMTGACFPVFAGAAVYVTWRACTAKVDGAVPKTAPAAAKPARRPPRRAGPAASRRAKA